MSINKLQELFNKFEEEFTGEKDRDERVLIIDGLNTFIRVFAAVPALNDDGMHVGGVTGFLRSIGSNIRQFGVTRCVVVFDGKGGSQRRRKIYPDYKGNRSNKTKLNRFDEFKDLVDEEESMKIQFAKLTDYFDVLPLTIISLDNIEADDVIAYISKQYYNDKDNEVIIVSTDRDFLQLVNNKIKVWSPIKKKLYDEERMISEFGIIPENYLLYRILDGDSSDNIPGINGIGLKTLIKRFPEIINEEITYEDLLNKSQEEIDNNSKLKLFNNIISNKEIIKRNFKLMQLKDVDISGTYKMNISSIMDKSPGKTNLLEFVKLLERDKLYNSFKDPHSWLRDTFSKLELYA